MSESGLRVDFYVLADASASARLNFACRLTEKAYVLNHAVHAHVDDAATARELDELLWTFRQGSFVPHEVVGPDGEAQAPVTIGFGDTCARRGGLLINLCSGIPTFFDRFERVAEIVDADDDRRRAGRERFGIYRDNGYAPQTHQLDATSR